jgi:hypothetical protein
MLVIAFALLNLAFGSNEKFNYYPTHRFISYPLMAQDETLFSGEFKIGWY